jgi:hypothetical protein
MIIGALDLSPAGKIIINILSIYNVFTVYIYLIAFEKVCGPLSVGVCTISWSFM